MTGDVEPCPVTGDAEPVGAVPVGAVPVGVDLRRRTLLAAAGAAAVGLVAAAVATDGRRDDPSPALRGPGAAGTPSSPVFGILGADRDDFGDLAGAGLDAVAVSVPWSRTQPEPGGLDGTVVDDALRSVGAAQDLGLAVVLSAGLQYPPPWVFDVPGGGRFVDQHGRRWHGPVGDDVADAVFDLRVRASQEDYLTRLGGRLAGSGLAGVRVGGLARGELHYPFVDRAGARNTLWAYSDAAQERSPLPGLRPGDGDEDDAAGLLGWYLDELADYGAHQASVTRESFGPGPELLLLMPSWGLRPGEADEAARGRLDGGSSGEQRGTVTEGLDWRRQLAAVADVPGLTPCCTWMDAEDQGDDDRDTSPVRYLHGLAARDGRRLWGENTGGNSARDLRRCVDLVDTMGMAGMFWMGAPDLGQGRNARLEDLADALPG